MDAIRAQGSPYIKIDTNQPAAASQILSRHGFVILPNQKDELHVVADADINPATITTLLVQNQIEVSQISRVTSSLEDLFFDLTRETERDR
jgi:hypothetical protein